jgi:hypothetical protein
VTAHALQLAARFPSEAPCRHVGVDEFLAALDEGKFDGVDPDVHPGLLDVLMALPLVR